jgi:hypothetical protein
MIATPAGWWSCPIFAVTPPPSTITARTTNSFVARILWKRARLAGRHCVLPVTCEQSLRDFSAPLLVSVTSFLIENKVCDHKKFHDFSSHFFVFISPIVTEHRHAFHYSKRMIIVNTSQGGPLAASHFFSFSESFFFRFFSLDTSAIFFLLGAEGALDQRRIDFFLRHFFS